MQEEYYPKVRNENISLKLKTDRTKCGVEALKCSE